MNRKYVPLIISTEAYICLVMTHRQIKGFWNGCKERQQEEKNKMMTIICFACLARLPYMWFLSANRTPTCNGWTHCLPVAVEGVNCLLSVRPGQHLVGLSRLKSSSFTWKQLIYVYTYIQKNPYMELMHETENQNVKTDSKNI